MDTIIRDYNDDTDRSAVIACLEELQEHLLGCDRWEMIQPLYPEFGNSYLDHLLGRVQRESGKVFVAEIDGEVVGCVIGVKRILATKMGASDCKEHSDGLTLELSIRKEWRRQNIGAKLLDAMETHYREAGVDVIKVGAVASNLDACKFYEKRGYEPWFVYFLKREEGEED